MWLPEVSSLLSTCCLLPAICSVRNISVCLLSDSVDDKYLGLTWSSCTVVVRGMECLWCPWCLSSVVTLLWERQLHVWRPGLAETDWLSGLSSFSLPGLTGPQQFSPRWFSGQTWPRYQSGVDFCSLEIKIMNIRLLILSLLFPYWWM